MIFQNKIIEVKMKTKFFSVSEVSDYIGISESTLNKMRMNNTGPEYQKIGGRIIYDKKKILSWVESKSSPEKTND